MLNALHAFQFCTYPQKFRDLIPRIILRYLLYLLNILLCPCIVYKWYSSYMLVTLLIFNLIQQEGDNIKENNGGLSLEQTTRSNHTHKNCSSVNISRLCKILILIRT